MHLVPGTTNPLYDFTLSFILQVLGKWCHAKSCNLNSLHILPHFSPILSCPRCQNYHGIKMAATTSCKSAGYHLHLLRGRVYFFHSRDKQTKQTNKLGSCNQEEGFANVMKHSSASSIILSTVYSSSLHQFLPPNITPKDPTLGVPSYFRERGSVSMCLSW